MSTTLERVLLDAMPNPCCEKDRVVCPYDRHDATMLAASVIGWLRDLIDANDAQIAWAATDPPSVLPAKSYGEARAEWMFRAIRQVILDAAAATAHLTADAEGGAGDE